MPSSIDPQLDVGNLSLNGLSTFSTILGTLSADNVQPVAMLQLEHLGAAFPISGPLKAKIPDHLQRCNNTRLDRLGLAVGWRKGDAASLMCQTAGGQAVALLATCLENLYGNDSAATILHMLSRTLLPNAAQLSSPTQLAHAVSILSQKLGVIGFGTILAKQVLRLHEAYQNMSRKPPSSFLATVNREGMNDILSKFSSAFQQDKSIIRVRGCAGIGYITALAVTLFSDDCLITVEDLIIHKGCKSSSICIEVTDSIGDRALQVQSMSLIESLLEISVRPSRLSASLKYSYSGHLAAYSQLYLQEWGLHCSPDVLIAIGTCILSLSDLISISAGGGARTEMQLSTNLFDQILGAFPRATLHRRCEAYLGVSLPLKWSSFPEEFLQLEMILARANQTESLSICTSNVGRHHDPSEALFRIIDEGVASIAIHVHEGAVWKERTERHIWHPSERIQVQGSESITLAPRELLYMLCSWDGPDLIAKSDGMTTLLPSGILHLGSDIVDNRGLELLDGPIYHQNRYYSQITSELDYRLDRNIPKLIQPNEIHPNQDGVHSELSLAILEQVQGLALECSVISGGQKKSISLRECVDQLFGLLNAYPCRHSRKAPLNHKHMHNVQTTSVLRPDARSGEQVSLVQTANNPTAQFLSLTKWEPALLCRNCCLNCAYEQAREKEIYKIIVA